MNVEEFIKETLVQIVRAVDSANKEFKADEIDGAANPRRKEAGQGMKEIVPEVHNVQFDIAVTVEEGTQTSMP